MATQEGTVTPAIGRVLKGGASLTISTGERLKLSPQDVEVPQVCTARSGAIDYPGTA